MNAHRQTTTQSLYQISTSTALVEGVHSGSVSSSVLLEHGDFGLGTFEGLDGEMVILDGQIYQVTDRVRHRTDDFLVPFASLGGGVAVADRLKSIGPTSARTDLCKNI